MEPKVIYLGTTGITRQTVIEAAERLPTDMRPLPERERMIAVLLLAEFPGSEFVEEV